MYTREKDGVVYIYRNEELFLASINRSKYNNDTIAMQMADYALQILPDNKTYARIIKDRSGIFNTDSQKLEKMMKIIAILLEDSEKSV
jgi:hypothetical protein